MLTGVGMVSGGRIFSYEEMALAAGTLQCSRAVARGVGGTEAHAPAAGASLTLDQPHRHWAAGGRVTALDRAHERVARLAAEHRPPALGAELDAELRRLAGIA
jgi:trimethylamine:corrinoid methyltransferase-like protein